MSGTSKKGYKDSMKITLVPARSLTTCCGQRLLQIIGPGDTTHIANYVTTNWEVLHCDFK